MSVLMILLIIALVLAVASLIPSLDARLCTLAVILIAVGLLVTR